MTLDRNEYAFSTWTLNRMTIVQALQMIHDCGFKNVEIWANNSHLDPQIRPNIEEIAALLKAKGMHTHSIHAPFSIRFSGSGFEKAYRDFRMNIWHQTIDSCEKLQCNKMVVHAIDSLYRYRPDQADIVHECLADLYEYGKEHGVIIALENIPFGRKPDELLCTLENQMDLFGDIGLKYCMDIGHVALNGSQMYRELDCAIQDIVSFHISNNDGKHDLHETPDRGMLNWPEIHDYVRAAGYKGKFVLEINGGEDQEEMLKRTAALFD